MKHRIRAQWLAWLWLIALLPAFASAATLQGKVVHIADGNTLTVLVDHQQVKVRLAEIDAPESHQDYGQRAKQALGTLVFGRDVSVADGGKDRYGRMIGHVHLGSMDVNAEMKRERQGGGYGRIVTRCRRGSGGGRGGSLFVSLDR